MNSRSVAYARSRLRTIGAFAAYLAWTTAVVELTITPLLFIFDFPEIFNGYLQAYGDQMPLLLEPGYQASPWPSAWYWRWT